MSLRGMVLALVGALSLTSISIAADWPMYGHDIGQSRSNPAETSITTANVASLKQLWVFKTAAPVSATPTVVNGVVYFGSWDHNFYAVNATTGALVWKVSLATPQGDSESFPGIQSSALVFGNRVYFGDSCGYLHAYPTNGSGAAPSTTMTVRNRGCGSTGTELPGFPIDLAGALPNSSDAPHADLFSSPVPFAPTAGANKGRPLLYIGEASHVDNPCIHGAEFAIDAKSGKIVWRFDVTPSSSIGGGVWSSPAIDAPNSLVYIDTGDCVNNASAGFSESIIALDASCSGVSVDGSCKTLVPEGFPPSPTTSGNPVWFFEAHPNGEIADLDFGSSPNVITSNGIPVLVGAGSKDGVYYAVKAGRRGGQLAWSTKVAEVSSVTVGTSVGGVLGGFNGSTGFANQKIYGTTVDGPEFAVALNALTGTLAWNAADAVSSFSAIGFANGIVYAGDNTGLFKARDASSGQLLFAVSVNGAVAGSPVPAEGKVFVPVGANTAPPGQQFGVYAFGL